MRNRNPVSLTIGDRVREREHVGDHVVSRSSPGYQRVCSIIGHRRHGVVVDVEVRRARNGSACKYIHVQWDHLNTPSVHAVSRIEKVSD